MATTNENHSDAEIAHFGRLAGRWWDADGDLRTLHDINPVRSALVEGWTQPAGRRLLDVGCGGGLFSEAMARLGAEVTGIDLSPEALAVARLHLIESGLQPITYRQVSSAALAAEQPGHYQIVTCMELLEHVPDPAALVGDCARLACPGGSVVFSTINRTAKAFALAIVGAEYLTRLVPRGTHRHERFIRPGELDGWARHAGLHLVALTGLRYEPLGRRCTAGVAADVNYVAHFRVPDRC